MSCKITIHESAEIELNDAADFYDIACVNLGGIFIDEVQRTIKKVSEFQMQHRSFEGKSERN
jgi:hypothetical protein